MTVAEAKPEARASRRNALIRRLYAEFPDVPAGAVADAVLHVWGDIPSAAAPDRSTSVELVERTAREHLRERARRAELAFARVRANRRQAAPARWRVSA